MRSTCWGPGPDSDCIIRDEHACCHPFDLAAALSPLLLEWALAKCVAFIPCSVCSTISSQGYMTLEESGGHIDVYMLSHIMPIICGPCIHPTYTYFSLGTCAHPLSLLWI